MGTTPVANEQARSYPMAFFCAGSAKGQELGGSDGENGGSGGSGGRTRRDGEVCRGRIDRASSAGICVRWRRSGKTVGVDDVRCAEARWGKRGGRAY